MSDTLSETIEHEGYTIEIHFQDFGQETADPRDMDNLGVMFAPHRRYVLGDADRHSDDYRLAERAFQHFTEYRSRGGLNAFERWLRVYLGATVVLRLGLIDHSGLSMYVGGGAHWADPGGWDSGTVGVIFDTEATRENCGTPLDRIEEVLRSEVEEYDKYLRGEVFGYVIRDEDGENADSCWGFLGSETAIEEAKGSVEGIKRYREANPKEARENRTLVQFTVADANAILGRRVLQSELSTLAKTLEYALAEDFQDAVLTLGAKYPDDTEG